jgi:N-ethylmaleimide reductase
VVKQLAPLGLAYVHVIEGATGGPRELPTARLTTPPGKAAYRDAGGQGAWMVNNGYDRALADAAAGQRRRPRGLWPPLHRQPGPGGRLHDNAPLNEPDRATFYGGGEKGYTDYPAQGLLGLGQDDRLLQPHVLQVESRCSD